MWVQSDFYWLTDYTLGLRTISNHQIEQFIVGQILAFGLVINGEEFDFIISLGDDEGIGYNTGSPTFPFAFRCDGHTDFTKMTTEVGA